MIIEIDLSITLIKGEICIKNSFKFKCSEFKETIKNNTKCLIYAKSNKNTIINLNRNDTYLILISPE